jgi:hypothetical protein
MSAKSNSGLVIAGVLILVGCSGDGNRSDANAVGGSTPSGGADALGGSTAQATSASGGTTSANGAASNIGGNSTGGWGGQTTSGGTQSTGGTVTGNGGALAGGNTGSGGVVTSGGTALVGGTRGTGGTKAGGGTAGTGRITSTGGLATTGGTSATGGTAVTGGTAATGGTKATGGVTSTAGASGVGGATGGALIRNDVFWKDTSGNPIYSQGGGVLRVGSTYYWYGVKYNGAVTYASKPTSLNSDTAFVSVTIYSSTDLANWKFENNALTAASLTAAGADPSNWVGRVGAAYNATTKKYILNGQYGGTPDTAQFFATSDTPNGAFKWDHTQATITNMVNNNCGDQAIFNDDDGQAYLVCSSLSGRSNLYVAPLRPTDFLNVEPATRVFGGAGREGNAMFKYNGRYYLCSSDLHGWNASHAYYISATNILGPYGTEGVIGNTDADFSHVTQTGLFITVPGSSQSTVIFGGDRWSDFAGNGIGYNQWVPLTFNGTTPVMQSMSEWTINAATGEWSVGPGNNYVLNPSFEADRVDMTQPAGWTTSNSANVSGGHTGRWSWQLSGTSSLDQGVTNLPSGTYTLTVWVKSSAAGAQLYAKGTGGTDKTASIASASAWTSSSISGIDVSNGKCNVGVTGSGQTVSVDDFTLIKN